MYDDCTGREARIDAPGAEPPRFPPTNVTAVQERLHRLLVEQQAQTVICSAACGADLLALEAAGALGIRRRNRAALRAGSLPGNLCRGSAWRLGERFDRILDAVEATGDLVVLGYAEAEEAAYLATNRTILGAGHHPCRAGAASCRCWAVVWDGACRGEDDVTAAFLEEAQRLGLTVWTRVTL